MDPIYNGTTEFQMWRWEGGGGQINRNSGFTMWRGYIYKKIPILMEHPHIEQLTILSL